MRLMKLRRTYLYFVSAAFILLAGCESDYENRYPFDNAAYIDVAETSSDNNVTFKKTVTQLDRELSAVLISPAKENIEVTFGIDPSLAATYNAKHDTKYAVLDESYYEFPERTATVEAGKSVSEPLTIHFKNLDQLDIDATQLLPVTIVSAGGGLSTLSGSQTVYYLVRRSSAITTAAVLTDNWIDVPAFDKAGTADCVNGLTAVTYEAIVRVHDFHYAGPTSSYIEEKLSTIMGVEQHLLLRIGDTNFYADQLQVDGSGVSLGKFPGVVSCRFHIRPGNRYRLHLRKRTTPKPDAGSADRKGHKPRTAGHRPRSGNGRPAVLHRVQLRRFPPALRRYFRGAHMVRRTYAGRHLARHVRRGKPGREARITRLLEIQRGVGKHHQRLVAVRKRCRSAYRSEMEYLGGNSAAQQARINRKS